MDHCNFCNGFCQRFSSNFHYGQRLVGGKICSFSRRTLFHSLRGLFAGLSSLQIFPLLLNTFRTTAFPEYFAFIVICLRGKKSLWTLLKGELCSHVERKLIFFLILAPQKNKRQSAYDGIRYDKLGTSGDVSKATKSPPQPKSTNLLISANDIELNHEKLEQAYQDLHVDGEEEEDDENEETRFINNKRSSFYTSSERT